MHLFFFSLFVLILPTNIYVRSSEVFSVLKCICRLGHSLLQNTNEWLVFSARVIHFYALSNTFVFIESICSS